MATPKQVEYALSLLAKAGYGIRFMSSKYKNLGARMRERSGSVRSWLEGMERPEISALIDRLRGLVS
jgi:hypothetical protein